MAIVAKRDRYTARTAIVKYSDFGGNLESSSGDVYKITNESAVRESLRNIVSTNKGERFFNPFFGCDIRQLLFENFDPSTESAIKGAITTAIEENEPRVSLLEVNLTPVVDLNAMVVTLIFRVINNPTIQSIDIILNRAR